MCYSAMVEQDAKKLSRQFDAEIKMEMYAELFDRRADGEKLLLNKAMEIPFLKSAKSIEERSIAKTIRTWHSEEIARIQKDLDAQTERLEKATESLKKKETKKALNDVRVATNKISKFKKDIEKHESEKIESESEERIFPKHYASVVLLDDKGKKIVMPMRYLMRPHDEDESFDDEHDGCYNARYDNLTRVKFWNDSLVNGRRGFIVVKKFYENVQTVDYLKKRKLPAKLADKDNIVVCFEPKGVSEMYIPVLWDLCKIKGVPKLYSMALITDDPPPEVEETGHNRCPIFLKEEALEEWLTSVLKSGKEIKENILSRRETPYYKHEVVGAAA